MSHHEFCRHIYEQTNQILGLWAFNPPWKPANAEEIYSRILKLHFGQRRRVRNNVKSMVCNMIIFVNNGLFNRGDKVV
jgi:hypothetical protein